jgi:hypothetical protein
MLEMHRRFTIQSMMKARAQRVDLDDGESDEDLDDPDGVEIHEWDEGSPSVDRMSRMIMFVYKQTQNRPI